MTGCTLHLLRHAEHTRQGKDLVGRILGIGLSEAGRAQAETLSETYRSAGLSAIVTSPVQRARETAAAIGDACGLPVGEEPGLDEVDFGDWAGLGFAALAGQPGWSDWNAARGLAATPGGETMLAVQARAMAAVNALARRHPGGIVLAVSHADVIKSVLAAVLGMPLDMMHRLEVSPGHRAIMVLGPGWARVDAVNLPP